MYHPGHAYLKRGSGMDGDPREHHDVHPDVAAAYKRVPSKDRSDFHRHCAEVEALSNAVKDGADLSQAHVASVSAMRPGDKSKEKRRDMKGLKVTAPCSSCKHVLENWRPNRKPPPGGGSSSGAAGGGGFSTMSGVN